MIDILHPSKPLLREKWGEFSNRISSISQWTTADETSFLMEVASRCLIVGEVGSYKGKSAKALAHACSGEVHCIDRFQDGTEPDFRNNLRDEIVSRKVTLYPMESADGAKLLTDAGVKFDMFFIDADHLKDDVVRDIDLWTPLVIDGGYILFHDCFPDDFPNNGIHQALLDRFPDFHLACDSMAIVQLT